MIDRLTGSNFTAGRDGERVETVILHWTVGTTESAIARFMDPTSRVSAHYVIARDGTVYRVVSETDTAWHAGDYTVNLRSIGIEHDAGPGRDPTEAQYAASARLVRELSARYGIPVDAQHIRPHRAIVATQCPGTLDVDRIVREATGGDMDEAYKAALQKELQEKAYAPITQLQLDAETLAKRIDKLERRFGIHGHTTSGPTT